MSEGSGTKTKFPRSGNFWFEWNCPSEPVADTQEAIDNEGRWTTPDPPTEGTRLILNQNEAGELKWV